MALAKELMGTSILQEKQPFINSKARKPMHQNPVSTSQNGSFKISTKVVVVKSAISEDIAKFVTKSDSKGKKVSFKVRGVLTVRNKVQEDFKETLVKKIDAFADQLIGRNVVLELFSLDIDPKTKAPKKSKEAVLKDWSQKANLKSEKVNYTSDIVIFNQTPAGIKLLREKELRDLRGDGTGVRKLSDRIYDYDVYNDLGNSWIRGMNLFDDTRRSKRSHIKKVDAWPTHLSGMILMVCVNDEDLLAKALARGGTTPRAFKFLENVTLDVAKWAGWDSQLKRVSYPPRVTPLALDLWQLAKWLMLRTHAAMEPFILSAHRQLSAMHPIYKLWDPHMRYTLEINAIARQNLLNADGVIEQGFTPGRYCMEINAVAYKHWRFDLEGLPADLIRRELQAWYAEVINVGHADLRHENWWPTLANPEDLTAILTTIIWLASAQHAALNFGQYPYGGYIPNRPPRMRRLIPDENDPEYTNFLEDPQNYFLLALPSMLQSTKYMAVVDTLSTHSPDEEYIGERQQRDTWSGDAEMVEAFYGFASEIQRIEKEIEKRNRDMSLKNRCGAGVLPYELLAPSSEPGVTCRGIPNSVSI
ncbi:linoleate 13S-lipoxygenase 3-1, chloroplastic [Tanacetum coccineum]